MEDWSDDKFWEELKCLPADVAARLITARPSKTIAPCALCGRAHGYGNMFLAGDAAYRASDWCTRTQQRRIDIYYLYHAMVAQRYKNATTLAGHYRPRRARVWKASASPGG